MVVVGVRVVLRRLVRVVVQVVRLRRLVLVLQRVVVVVRLVAVALHAPRQPRHPAPLLRGGARQQQQLARPVRVQLARRHALALAHVLRVDLHAAPPTLVCLRRADEVPKGSRADLAGRRDVVRDAHQVMALVLHCHTGVVAGVLRRVLRVPWPPGLALARVQQLEDARDVLRVRADHVALRHRTHVEHLAQIQYHDRIRRILFIAL